MINEPRRTRFHDRIKLEREVLTAVNKRFGSSAPLAGMTSQAIESWERRALDLRLQSNVPQIAKLLREAALRAELTADNSREVFELGRTVSRDGIAEIAAMLEVALDGKIYID